MRSRMNALVSQPLVGMIDGVAARRARFFDSESYASFSDRTRMLARRASASTSARAASACCPPGPSALRLSRSDHMPAGPPRSEEHTSELQSRLQLVCRLLLEK